MPLPWDFHSLEGERVHLDPLRSEDEEELYALHSDPEVCRYLLFEPRTRAEVAAVLERDAGRTRLKRSATTSSRRSAFARTAGSSGRCTSI